MTFDQRPGMKLADMNGDGRVGNLDIWPLVQMAQAGTQFDPFLLLQLLTVIEKNGLIEIDPGFLIQTRQDIMKSFTQHRP